ncbi:MAG: hypothetical protein ABSB69_06370 [Solirubrobacteraceae bacterium]
MTALRALPRSWRPGRAVVLSGMLLAVLGVLAPVALAAEAPSVPHWTIESRPAPTNLPPFHDGTAGKGLIVMQVDNLGDVAATGTTNIVDRLPAHMKAGKVTLRAKGGGNVGRRSIVECVTAPSGSEVSCSDPQEVVPYEELVARIPVEVEEGAQNDTGPGLDNVVVVTGGGATEAKLERAVSVSEATPSFGVEAYELTPENERFERDMQAGSHPFQLTTTFNLNEALAPEEPGSKNNVPAAPALQKNLTFELPAGLLGNVNAVPECSDSDFGSQEEEEANGCAADTAVGVASVTVNVVTVLHYSTLAVPVFNLVPAPGEPARFGFEVDHVPIVLTTSVRTGADYGVNVSVHNASASVQVLGSKVTFWGVPADPRHNASRGWSCLEYGSPGYRHEHPCEANAKPAQPKPFLTLPPSCETLETFATGDAWDGGGEFTKVKGEERQEPGALTGCKNLPTFNPTVQVHPETESASTPTGLTVQVNVPQETTLESTLEGGGRAEPDIESTTLVLPEGLQASPAAASGLVTCSVEQAGFNGQGGDPGEAALAGELELQSFTPLAASCLKEAKIGTVNIKTPVLKEEVVGSVYLASQDTNPFTSPLVLYIIAEEPTSKVLVKLAGEVKMDAVTGQLTSVFRKTPQTPFETLTLHLTSGERASQSTPARCGENYSATATFHTWSSPEAATEAKSNPAEFKITSGPGGSACPGATLPFAPGFQAGSTNSQAGAFTPFTLTISKPDGQQALESITAKLPPGMAAEIAAVTPCPDPQALEALPTLTSTEPPCGEESLIGHTSSSSGLGGKPVTLPGRLYLTQGVDGAPFGLLASTEAKAGPFNLGWVNVLSTITVNETTAAVTTNTVKPIPTILDGVPVQLKQINVTVERPGNAPFQFNPTSCTPMSVGGTLTGSEGASDPVSYPFSASNCGSLPFAPKLTASVVGQGSKLGGTTFSVKIESPGIGQANIHKVDLTIPGVLPSRLTTIQKACLEAVFNANPASCDEGSVIGEGIVYTPVLKNPLRGPAYLVSHGGAAFPDVEFVLQGEGVRILLDGKTDIKNKVTYSRFETAPDAPFTKFETIFPAGPHSALTPSVSEKENFNLCKQKISLPTEITGQNGAFIPETTNVAITGCKGVAAFKATKAQLLAKALKACKKDKKKSKRVACEKRARKKYGTKAKKASKKGAKKSSKR